MSSIRSTFRATYRLPAILPCTDCSTPVVQLRYDHYDLISFDDVLKPCVLCYGITNSYPDYFCEIAESCRVEVTPCALNDVITRLDICLFSLATSLCSRQLLSKAKGCAIFPRFSTQCVLALLFFVVGSIVPRSVNPASGQKATTPSPQFKENVRARMTDGLFLTAIKHHLSILFSLFLLRSFHFQLEVARLN